MKFSSLIKLSLVGVFSVGLIACASNKDNRPKPTPLSPIQASLNVDQMWSNGIGSGNAKQTYNLAPTSANGIVYTVGSNGQVSAQKTANGDVLWRTNIKKGITSAAGIGPQLLAVGNTDSELTLIDKSSGKVVNTIETANEVLARPALTGQVVIVKTLNDDVFAYNINTGKQVWHYAHGAPSLILQGASAPQVSADKVVVGFADGQLSVLNSSSGKELWQTQVAEPRGMFSIQRLVDITGRFVIRGGVIYVAAYQGNVVALDLATGSQLWSHQLSSYRGLSVDASQVYVTDSDSQVWAFDRSSGRVEWRQGALKYRDLTAPAVLSNALAVADAEGYIHWLAKRDGHIIARYKAGGDGVSNDLLALGNNLFVTTNAGELQAYHS